MLHSDCTGCALSDQRHSLSCSLVALSMNLSNICRQLHLKALVCLIKRSFLCVRNFQRPFLNLKLTARAFALQAGFQHPERVQEHGLFLLQVSVNLQCLEVGMQAPYPLQGLAHHLLLLPSVGLRICLGNKLLLFPHHNCSPDKHLGVIMDLSPLCLEGSSLCGSFSSTLFPKCFHLLLSCGHGLHKCCQGLHRRPAYLGHMTLPAPMKHLLYPPQCSSPKALFPRFLLLHLGFGLALPIKVLLLVKHSLIPTLLLR
mmetsp:Transcript_35543/g.81434  ORF Transcript_35543/g.81434 Transcript_35543/m.81434 type:complete len:257 (-) Transcript_35543:4184-4954(-)